jgi:glycosyltransferase involved in cell wall biosynthesis
VPEALPKITVVTPVYNGAATIEHALASVRGQVYPDVEHVVVDGGSTDGTVEILERAEGIRYISEPDEGLADAMNKGIAMAQGELVGWLNCDDVYFPGTLMAVGRAAAEHPDAAWVTGRCRIVDGDGKEIRKAITAWKNLLLSNYSFGLYLTQNFVSCPSTFVRRSAYEAVGPIDTGYRYSMDYEVFLRIAKLSDPVVLERELAAFTMVAGTLSMTGFEDQFDEHLRQARMHGDGHRVAVLGNEVMSRLIVLVYRALRESRRLRAAG